MDNDELMDLYRSMELFNDSNVGEFKLVLGNSTFYENCPQCGTVNYVVNDDIDDLVSSDVEALICYRCYFKWLLQIAGYWVDLDDAITYRGAEEP
jgi:hypothetical protein